MLVLKNKPVDVDVPVQRMQTFLFNQLKALWSLTDSNFEAHGRCYREQADKGYMPRFFQPSAAEGSTTYGDIFFDDSNTAALFFFDVHDTTKYEDGTSKVDVDLIFIVNITSLKPTLEHRGDAEIRNEVMQLCTQNRYGFKLTGMETGYKNVFNRFDAMLTNDQVSFRDSHPLHVFKISFSLIYDVSNNC